MGSQGGSVEIVQRLGGSQLHVLCNESGDGFCRLYRFVCRLYVGFLEALHRVTHASSVSPKDHDNRRQLLKCRLQCRALL